jgi:D-glycero-alpha-D-manno-heptose-7-phosphate kinase
MIISKTPYRISFFGGGTDYPLWFKKYKGNILSTTIDKHVYLSLRNLPPYFNYKYRIVWSKVENVKNLNLIQHNVVREMFKYFKLRDGMDLHYQGDLPARSGMGSSSSFVVGLMKILLLKKKINVSNQELAKKCIFFEQKILKETVGIQDQISATYGGFNKISIEKNGTFKINKIKIDKNIQNFSANLMLLFTGIYRTANEIAGQYVTQLTKNKILEMKRINEQVTEGEKLLKSYDFDSFGRLLNESWMLKKSLSKVISNNKINDLYNFTMQNGALGGKLLGAGGGGFMLFYMPVNLQKKFLDKIKKKVTRVPFNFSNEGSTIILNKN